MTERKSRIDAGLAGLDHYKVRLPNWRYHVRKALLPVVREETPYVAYLQESLRSPTLDSYFAMTANLGTHTAFMLVLPILFWCGYMSIGKGMVHILALGVYLSGVVKDLLCLPRPLSPPLTRISMSGSAALEYGFPSTHSTNAVSVAYYVLYILQFQDPDPSQKPSMLLQLGLYFYAGSIILGRIYCGMHGFFDVFIGSALGAAIAAVQCHFGAAYDEWLYSSTANGIFLVVLVMLVAVRIHPEPADNCPCYDDSVAFAGTMIGVEYASWLTAHKSVPPTLSPNIPFDLQQMGWLITSLRIVLGIFMVLAWRATMKPLLLKGLPPIFRVVESVGMDSPRVFFVRASQYTSVPRQKQGDNIIPSASDIPKMLSNLRRQRAVSVGPQSEADAREVIAYREKQRRDSVSQQNPAAAKQVKGQTIHFASDDEALKQRGSHSRKRSSSIEKFRQQMGTSVEALSPLPLENPLSEGAELEDKDKTSDLKDQEMFASIQKPRVRYDVEVVTKLIVYSGIGWISVYAGPSTFNLIGWSI